MYSRSRAWDFHSNYASRYHVMIESSQPEDHANSEACRLASQAWQDIAQYCQNPANIDEGGKEIEFDVESVILDIKSRWDDYCRTGVPRHEVDELAKEIRDKHAQALANRRLSSTEFIQRLSECSKEQSIAQEKNPKSKKGTKVQSESQPADLPGPLSGPSELIDEENRKHIQIEAIDFVINESRLELGVEVQEQESMYGGIQFNQV